MSTPRMLITPRVNGLSGFYFLNSDRLYPFVQPGNFESMFAAERWLEAHGFTLGPCQRGDPRGIKRGTARVPKWRALTEAARGELDGIMLGPRGSLTMVHGPITVRLREDVAPKEIGT